MSRVTLSRFLIEQTRSNNTPADLRFLIESVLVCLLGGVLGIGVALALGGVLARHQPPDYLSRQR